MLSGVAASAVASRILHISRTTWTRTAGRSSTQPSWRSHLLNSQGFSRLTARVAPHGRTPSPVPPPLKSGRLARTSRGLGYIGLGAVAAWYLDREFYASTVSRNIRTLWTVGISATNSRNFPLTPIYMQCAIIALDYKINFTAANSQGIPAIHERVAERVFDLLTSNGGLYIKIGMSLPHPHAGRVALVKLSQVRQSLAMLRCCPQPCKPSSPNCSMMLRRFLSRRLWGSSSPSSTDHHPDQAVCSSTLTL